MPATLDDLLAAIRHQMYQGSEGKLFGSETRNHVGGLGDYLFDTPHGRWDDPSDLAPPHSSRLPEMIRAMIATATHWVDILTMDEPTGEFLEQIVGGISDALIAKRQPVIRFLIGSSVPNDPLRTDIMLGKIAETLKENGGVPPEMYLGHYRYDQAKSWNHAKVVAVDGRMMMTGGHNLWAPAYLEKQPIFDMSMRFDGPITKGGHQFANALWKFVRDNNVHTPGTRIYSNSLRPENPYVVGKDAPRSDWSPQADPPPPPGELPAIWVTNSGWGVFENYIDHTQSSGSIAFVEAMRNGTRCRISQQDFGARYWYYTPDFTILKLPSYSNEMICYDWCFFDLNLVDAIAGFLLRDGIEKLEVVLTSPDGTGRYNNKIPFKAIYNVVGYRMASFQRWSKVKIMQRFRDKFFLTKISSAGKDVWSTGHNKRNHAKFWMVDNLFYVGSENFYPSTVPPGAHGSIQEFGVVMEDSGGKVRDMICKAYFDPMMAKASRTYFALSDMTWPD